MNLPSLTTLPALSLPAGHEIITQGRPIEGVYFLEQGELQVFKNEVLIAEIFDAGAVLGEMSWLLKTPPTATVRTATPCVFRHVAQPDDFFSAHPEAAIHLAVILARRVDSLNRYLVEIKNQFKDQNDHLAMVDEVLGALMNKHPRDIPRRATGD